MATTMSSSAHTSSANKALSVVYGVDLAQEEQSHLDAVLDGFYGSLKSNDTYGGVTFWLQVVNRHLDLKYRLVGQKFVEFARVLFELTLSTPSLDIERQTKWMNLLTRTLRKNKKNDVADLVLQWRPLYELLTERCYSKQRHGTSTATTLRAGAITHASHLRACIKLCKAARRYFSRTAQQEILDTIKPLQEEGFAGVLRYQTMHCLLLPVRNQREALLILSESMNHWNDLGARCTLADFAWMSFFSRAAKRCLQPLRIPGGSSSNHDDDDSHVTLWSSTSTSLFGHIHASLDLAMAGAGGRGKSVDLKPKTLQMPAQTAAILKPLLGGGNASTNIARESGKLISRLHRLLSPTVEAFSPFQHHFARLFTSISSYFHPSNQGNWTQRLAVLLQSTCEELSSQYAAAAAATSDEVDATNHPRIDNGTVLLLLPLARHALFGRSHDMYMSGAVSLKYLLSLNPSVLVREIVNLSLDGLGTLVNNHQPLRIIEMLGYVIPLLIDERLWNGIDGEPHLFLRQVLPMVVQGVNINDKGKTMATYKFCLALFSSCSPPSDHAHHRLTSSVLEEFSLTLLTATLSFLRALNEPKEKGGFQERWYSFLFQRTCLAVFSRLSPSFAGTVCDDLVEFVDDSAYPHASAEVAVLCRCAATAHPIKMGLRLFDVVVGKLLTMASSRDGGDGGSRSAVLAIRSDETLQYYIALLSGIVGGIGVALFPSANAGAEAKEHAREKKLRVIIELTIARSSSSQSHDLANTSAALLRECVQSWTVVQFRDGGVETPSSTTSTASTSAMPSYAVTPTPLSIDAAHRFVDCFLDPCVTLLQDTATAMTSSQHDVWQALLVVRSVSVAGARLFTPAEAEAPLEDSDGDDGARNSRPPVSGFPLNPKEKRSIEHLVDTLCRSSDVLLRSFPDKVKILRQAGKALQATVCGRQSEQRTWSRLSHHVHRQMKRKMRIKNHPYFNTTPRSLKVLGVGLQHIRREMHSFDNRVTSSSVTRCMSSLFELSTESVYAKVRCSAQTMLVAVMKASPHLVRDLIHRAVDIVSSNDGLVPLDSSKVARIKGALYLLASSFFRRRILREWKLYGKTMQSIAALRQHVSATSSKSSSSTSASIRKRIDVCFGLIASFHQQIPFALGTPTAAQSLIPPSHASLSGEVDNKNDFYARRNFETCCQMVSDVLDMLCCNGDSTSLRPIHWRHAAINSTILHLIWPHLLQAASASPSSPFSSSSSSATDAADLIVRVASYFALALAASDILPVRTVAVSGASAILHHTAPFGDDTPLGRVRSVVRQRLVCAEGNFDRLLRRLAEDHHLPSSQGASSGDKISASQLRDIVSRVSRSGFGSGKGVAFGEIGQLVNNNVMMKLFSQGSALVCESDYGMDWWPSTSPAVLSAYVTRTNVRFFKQIFRSLQGDDVSSRVSFVVKRLRALVEGDHDAAVSGAEKEETPRSHYCLVAEVIGGLVRASYHWSHHRSDIDRMWEQVLPFLSELLTSCPIESIPDMSTCLRFCLAGRPVDHSRPLLLLIAYTIDGADRNSGVSNEPSGDSTVTTSAATTTTTTGVSIRLSSVALLRYLTYISEMLVAINSPCLVDGGELDSDRTIVDALLDQILGGAKPLIEHPSAQVREVVAKCLACSITNSRAPSCATSISVDIDTSAAPQSFNAIVERMVAHVEQRHTSQEQTEADGNMDSGNTDVSINDNHRIALSHSRDTFLGVLNALVHAGTVPYIRACDVARITMLVFACQDDPDTDVSKKAKATSALLAQALTTAVSSVVAGSVSRTIADSRWNVQRNMLAYLQMNSYKNAASLTSREHSELFHAPAISMLTAARYEVRETACSSLVGMLRAGTGTPGDADTILDLSRRFTDMAGEPVQAKRRRRKERQPPSLDAIGGVLGLSALVLSSPYEITPWLPEVLVTLSRYQRCGGEVLTHIKRTISEFWRVHKDTWHLDQKHFSREQLDEVGDLLLSPSYYA